MKSMYKKLNLVSLNNSETDTRESGSANPLRRCLICLFVVICLSGMEGQLKASDWMFQQSYFSHNLPDDVAVNYPQPESRTAYRKAWVNFTPGISVRGGYRYNRIFLRSGNSTDTTVIQEGWFGFQP